MNAANAAPAAVPVSFEFFPPKTPEGIEKLRAVRQQLYALQPQFCSVTYGAGGSTQDGTLQAVQAILDEGQQGASHFTCVGASRDSVREKLALFQSMGVRRLVALRGDLPSGYGSMGEFRYAADLVAFIRAETGDHFHLEVAAYPEMHPQARSPEATCRPMRPRSRPVPTRRSRSSSSTPTPTSALWTRRASWALTCRWCRASCPSPTPAACCALPTVAAPKCRAGFACACKAWGTMRRASGLSGWMWSPACASSCWLLERRACTSIR